MGYMTLEGRYGGCGRTVNGRRFGRDLDPCQVEIGWTENNKGRGDVKMKGTKR